MIKEKEIVDFESLIEALFSYDLGYVFRGQRNSDWALESTLSRVLNRTGDVATYSPIVEGVIKDVLESRIHHYIHRDEAPKSLLGWHAIAQHHGAPTRLVDFTVLPLVALYFATKNLQECDDNCAIWVINFRDLNADCEGIFPGVKIDQDPDAFFDEIAKCSENSELQGLWVGEPRKVNLRLERQGGTFLIPTCTNKSIGSLLTEVGSRCHIRVEKLVISATLLPQIRLFLKRSGVTGSRLFDGVDGLVSEATDDIHRIVSGLENDKEQSALATD